MCHCSPLPDFLPLGAIYHLKKPKNINQRRISPQDSSLFKAAMCSHSAEQPRSSVQEMELEGEKTENGRFWHLGWGFCQAMIRRFWQLALNLPLFKQEPREPLLPRVGFLWKNKHKSALAIIFWSCTTVENLDTDRRKLMSCLTWLCRSGVQEWGRLQPDPATHNPWKLHESELQHLALFSNGTKKNFSLTSQHPSPRA